MDAVRLIVASRRALTAGGDVPHMLAEVWQAQALAQAIGSRLAVLGPAALRGEALGLTELAGRGCGVLGTPELPAGELRAAQLTELGDARQTLVRLGTLLAETGIALVAIACAVDDEGTYWQCVEAIDAADESRDRVLHMLGRLAEEDGVPAREAG
ncbi:DUF6099 family protein [Streptomyces griseoviridis]|jgi:hypothetical protein|uniref:Uncharacterized protein n=3 Tax=Streptomyces TaxID=1883 RepID=A0A918LKJ3_STRGD|nr:MULTISPECIES: DUF6099 family protein [Streptomyces]MDP9684652.1 hypothetical protein [Streptomyces griseoviridis]GGS63709.1 hypothetical protein GCM10010238_60940 [Streptomyces niveoruber]GGT21154.1 hypothetical protein GCM10010240_62550 [Streptomyces griseoviridis]GGU62088.1 hypothetical protein GCM10010259_60950 [Streptomyces daghestanicus]GHI30394.1 hypothetical protein Sdagh_21240 [Streptomyces daghestanicus]